ncbi:preprotein translocase subunit YajC [Nocardia huaxiensis]|uniref:Preprotein translocase subunit YajC n=1 Tax=Nocardia huaxiensis TaxID=2755382 RepID=A0A7D6VBS6_9NOCA|nr:preprotein translocase subunit YajC [Nocardia huaxiensis]QLY29137.1 preprotein translocase subunit YajC [Nocardia huaxiensis]UFS97370.1 preprotein translocase subunit YajC [Nocardia huaxiensis]
MDLLLPLLLVALLIPMFLGVRRQKREMAKVTEMQDNLKVGDRVITTSGLYGTVVDTDDTSVDLEIAEDVVTTWSRAAIREIRNDDVADTTEDSTPDTAPAATEATGETADEAPRLTKD